MEITVESLQQIYNLIPHPNCGDWLYRGMPPSKEIVASLFYDGLELDRAEATEKTLLSSFSEESRLPHDEFKTMFIARHFGLCSRFIDMTIDITIGLHFAFQYSPAEEKEALLYAFAGSHFGRVSVEDVQTDILGKRNHWIINPSISYSAGPQKEAYRRMLVQSGKFLYQPLETASVALTSQLETDWYLFKIPKNAFGRISEEVKIKFDGKDINVSPLPDKSHAFDAICKTLNSQIMV